MIWVAPSEMDTAAARLDTASDARDSEQEIRQRLIESLAVDVMVAVGPNLFYTVTPEKPVGSNLLEELKLAA